MVARQKTYTDTNPNPAPIDYERIEADLVALYKHPRATLAVDTETTGLAVHDGRARAIGVSYATLLPDGSPLSGYVAFDHRVGRNAPLHIQDMLKYVLEQEGRSLIYQGAQFDIASLATIDIDTLDQEFYDVPTMANLIDENMPNKGMDFIARKFAPDMEKLTDDEWLNHQKVTGWSDTTPERMYDYATNDAEVTFVSWDQMIQHREWLALHESIWPIKQRVIRALYGMRQRGVLLDKRATRLMAERGNIRMAEILEELGYEKLGPIALTELLLEQLQLPVIKRSAKTSKPSFDREVMEEYDEMLEQVDSNLGKLILEYRGWQKAVSAGYQAYLDVVSPDGRVRTEYTTHVVRTGRLSSKNPNLQQIPKESDREKKPWNWQMKAVFIPKPGYKLWNIDYSQLELRLMAAFAGVSSLKQVFLEGRDIFTEISEQIGKPRQTVKTMVYANSYGAGPAKIARSTGLSLSAAKAMLDDYYSSYPELRIFSRKLETIAKRSKKIPLWSGRFRHMPYPKEAYKALNSFIQGGGADIVERAMVRVSEEVCDTDCRLLMQVHDAFVFEIREGLEEEYLPRLIDIMCDVDAIVAERVPQGLGTKIDVEADAWPVFEEENDQ